MKTTSKRYYNPEKLLTDLGVTKPSEIHIEAIALFCQAKVKYRELNGCDASIVGNGEKAIISINSSIENTGRRRFSIAHELGHWMYDRGKGEVGFKCKYEDIGAQLSYSKTVEHKANDYAVNLLLPEYIFEPIAKNKEMTLDSASELASEFKTSLTSTALRLIRFGSYPAMVVSYCQEGRKWFKRSSTVPEFFFPHKELHYETDAFKILFGNEKKRTPPVDSPADIWIDRRGANYYNVIEQTVKVAENEIISMIWWKDESHIIEACR